MCVHLFRLLFLFMGINKLNNKHNNNSQKCAARGSLKMQFAKIRQKIRHYTHHSKTVSGYIFATKTSTIQTKLVPHNTVNFDPLALAAEIGWRVCHPSKFQRVSRLYFVTVTALTSLNGGQSNFARCLAVGWYIILMVGLTITLLSSR